MVREMDVLWDPEKGRMKMRRMSMRCTIGLVE